MLRTALLPIFASLIVSHAAEAVTVDLNQPDTYRALFDAGLQPRKAFREKSDGLLEIRPAREISFRIGGIQIPPTRAVWSFNVANNNQITIVRGIVEEAWSKAEAFEKTRGLEAALGGDVAALKQWIDSHPVSSATGGLWSRKWRSEDGTRSVKYYFRHTMQDARPLTISVSMELHWPERKRGFRETPLKPPAGYEHADISFDETYGGTATMPSPAAPKPTVPTLDHHSPHDWRKASNSSHQDPAFSMPWSIVTVLIMAACGLLWFLWLLAKNRKRRPATSGKQEGGAKS